MTAFSDVRLNRESPFFHALIVFSLFSGTYFHCIRMTLFLAIFLAMNMMPSITTPNITYAMFGAMRSHAAAIRISIIIPRIIANAFAVFFFVLPTIKSFFATTW